MQGHTTYNFILHLLQVYIAEVECDVNIAVSRNIHGWKEDSLRKLSKEWNPTPEHFNKLDLRGFLQDKEITQVEMEDAEQDPKDDDSKDNSPIPDDEVRFLIKKKSNFAVIIDQGSQYTILTSFSNSYLAVVL